MGQLEGLGSAPTVTCLIPEAGDGCRSMMTLVASNHSSSPLAPAWTEAAPTSSAAATTRPAQPSQLGSTPLLMMTTEADDRRAAAGKLAKAISRPLASGCCRRPPSSGAPG
jgi:hypothetical protein